VTSDARPRPAAQRAAAAAILAEDEYDGADLIGLTAKTLRRVRTVSKRIRVVVCGESV
jgi:hypothetical protein